VSERLTDSVTLYAGDCIDVLKQLEPNSLDACVTDPPYGLGFMGKAWDHGVPGLEYWREVFRVLKPGAHLLAFGGTRTFGRMHARTAAGLPTSSMTEARKWWGVP
jgi:DNA modification methylase